MKYWIMIFRPDTYEQVRAHGTIGVRTGARKVLHALSVGDRFIAYVSQKQQLDGAGTIASTPFVDETPIFATSKAYEHRCKVTFTEAGHERPAGDALWELSVFPEEMRTTPSNYICCKGGIMEISAEDYELLVRVMRGEQEPMRFAWRTV